MKLLVRIRPICGFATLAITASMAVLCASSTARAGTTYIWNPTALANTNWDNTASAGWNTGAGFPGSAGDLTGGAVENDVANMNSKAYTGGNGVTPAISMNGIDAYLSEMDIGSTATGSSAVNWAINDTGGIGGGSLNFKALSGTAVLKSTTARSNKVSVIYAPVKFISNTNVSVTPPNDTLGYVGLSGAVTGGGNLTVSLPLLGTNGHGVFYVDGVLTNYTGTINFDATGTTNLRNDSIGLIGAGNGFPNARQMTLNLSGPSNLGRVGIFDLELGSLQGTGGYVNPYNAATAATLKIGYKNNPTDSYSGVIASFISLQKVGTGTQILDGANTYFGTTAVNAGKLLVNGTHTGGGAYSVASGATLGGTGSIGAAVVTVDAGGFLAPGASIESLDVGAAVINGTLAVEYQGITGAGNDLIDLLNVASGLDITNATVDFASLGGTLDDSALVFAKYSTLTGAAFATVSNLPAGYQISYAYNDGNSSNNIALVAVPEPGAIVLTVIGIAGVALCCMRRQGFAAEKP